MEEKILKSSIGSMADDAARLYRKKLNATSGMMVSEYFKKAEDCFRAGYEKALLDILGESDVAYFQQVKFNK